MRILAVDTSSERGSICVSEDNQVLGEIRLSSSIQHSERLFRSIEFLFQYLPFALKDVDIFVASRGPGSFTGLRVGLAAMEGFVAAFGKQGAGITTLQALAWAAGGSGESVAATIDARRNEIYGAVYRRWGNELVEVREPVVLKPAEWFSSLPDEPILFCGDGADRYQEWIASNPRWQLRRVDGYLAAAMAEIAVTPARGPLQPLYVRKTDAEIARERRHESIAGPNP